jgi:hypothetical protein
MIEYLISTSILAAAVAGILVGHRASTFRIRRLNLLLEGSNAELEHLRRQRKIAFESLRTPSPSPVETEDGSISEAKYPFCEGASAVKYEPGTSPAEFTPRGGLGYHDLRINIVNPICKLYYDPQRGIVSSVPWTLYGVDPKPSGFRFLDSKKIAKFGMFGCDFYGSSWLGPDVTPLNPTDMKKGPGDGEKLD